jgi:hypothetical protein
MEKENRGEKKSPPKKNLNLKLYKKNTIKSLKETEFFLNNLNHFFRYVKLYKLFK